MSVLIVTLRNEVMGDDGVGIKVGKILKERGYRVEELGTDVFYFSEGIREKIG